MAEHKVGRIAVRCVGGCMDGRYVEAGVGTQFFRTLAGNEKGYLPDVPVHCYRLHKSGPGEYVFLLEGGA